MLIGSCQRLAVVVVVVVVVVVGAKGTFVALPPQLVPLTPLSKRMTKIGEFGIGRMNWPRSLGDKGSL